MIVVSGNAFARSVTAGICGWYCHASKLRFELAQPAQSPRESAPIDTDPAVGLVCEFLTAGIASKPPACRMPRKRAGAAAICACKHFIDRGSQRQIGEADDSRRDPRLAILPAGALRRDAVDELGLAHRPHRLRGRPRDTSRGIRRTRSRARDGPMPVSRRISSSR